MDASSSTGDEVPSNEIELISDGDGLAILGSSEAVELFLDKQGLASKAVSLTKDGTVSRLASIAASVGSTAASQSGQWVKLTEESAKAISNHGLMPTGTPGVSHAMIGTPGQIDSWVQILQGPRALASNPAMLAGAAGLMAQVAMQQSMAEITDYLKAIDEKLDDVIRHQTNQVLARMDGVDLAVREAMTVRDAVGRVSDVTWSKVQHSSGTILETQAYALRQLDDLAHKFEAKARVDELVKHARSAETDVRKWLTVLARCVQLNDAVAVLELDRVMDTAPDELDSHRLGLKAARDERLALLIETSERLIERMRAAASTANSKVLFNPIQSPAVVAATNHVSIDVSEFHVLLEIEADHRESDTRAWTSAAGDKLGQVRSASAKGVGSVKGIGAGAKDRITSATDTVTARAGDAGSDGISAVQNLGGVTADRAKSLGGKLKKRVKRGDDNDSVADPSGGDSESNQA